jgi:P27 family predicted phage terminase small subunit
MAMPRKNEKVHWLEGTKSRVKDTPGFKAGRPKFPKHLCPAARAEFKRCVGLLEERGTITPGDVTILAVYSEVFSRWVQAKQSIGNELMVTTTILDPHGKEILVQRLNPLLRVAESCEAKLVTLASKLGLTPVDRARSKQTEIEPKDEPVPTYSFEPREVIQFTPTPPPDTLDE